VVRATWMVAAVSTPMAMVWPTRPTDLARRTLADLTSAMKRLLMQV
jgi:hypothetical protein